MFIPSTDVWAAVGTIITAAIIFAFATSRSLGKMLTRKEHQSICDSKNQEITRTLDRIEGNLSKHMEETREHRDRMNNTMHAMQLRLAVLTHDQEIPDERS